jgi:hypothetical protein
MLIGAFAIGLLIVAQGVLGLVAPDLFVGLVRTFQTPPVIYGAAVVRFAVGVVLFRAARESRARVALRGLGSLVALGGILTPIIGIPFARVVLGWWSDGGHTLVRIWAGAAFLLGLFIVYVTLPGLMRGAQDR